MTGFEIREVRPDEEAAAGEVVVEAYRALPGTPPVDDNGYAVELRDVARRAREAVVLVAVEVARVDGAGAGAGADAAVGGGAVLGCVTYVPDESSLFAEEMRPGEAGLRMLGVAPTAQGRGVGRALVEACIERARKEGKDRLFLHSGVWMRGAHALYESLGFTSVPERDWEPVPDIPLRGFALDLSDAP